jgi:hypothetical protein
MKESILLLKEAIQQNHWLFWVIIILCLWDGIWKLIALWKAARSNQLGWFIALAIFNTVGILPIIYMVLINKKPSTIK